MKGRLLFSDLEEKSISNTERFKADSPLVNETPSCKKFQTPYMPTPPVPTFLANPVASFYEKVINGGCISERLRRPVMYEFDIYLRVKFLTLVIVSLGSD